jgi:hypothetical protein
MGMEQPLAQRLLGAVAIRPAAPGLLLVVALVAIAISGWTVTSVAWFWPAVAVVVVLPLLLNAARQDVWRRMQSHEHKQRMNTANALLNEHPPAAEPAGDLTGSIRELGARVERFGLTLDELLAEVHAEKTAADQRPRRS